MNVNRKILAAAVLAAALLAYYALRRSSAPPPSGFFPGGENGLSVSTGSFSGGSFWGTLMELGRPGPEIAALEKALRRSVKGGFPRSGDLYALALSTSGELGKFSLVSGDDLYELTRTTGSEFSVAVSSLPVHVETRAISGTIRTSLWESLSGQGVPPPVIMDYADIYAWEIDFLTEPREGDRYAFVLETGAASLGRPVFQRITAAMYTGGETGERTAFLYKGGYYGPDGRSLKRQFLRAPLAFRRISSYFNPRRFHPVLRIFRPHNGIDYSAPAGTPVSSVADGTVVFAGWKGGYGKFVEIRHGGTYATGYGHLRGFAKGVRSGARVSQGD
ncbi:MAG TPA: peptidoglycan DD-metalloendopeptidase family protein, partial [Elusimicrobiales bacterium]|nr:peptidoglycan DD-metalloendopeptidase family protein [Elusimicrobiales bacterium]